MKRTLLLTFLSLLVFFSAFAQNDLIIVEHGVIEDGVITEPGGTEDFSGTTQTLNFETTTTDQVVEYWVKNTSETETYTVRCRRLETNVLAETRNNACWVQCPFPPWVAGENPDWTVTGGATIFQETIGPGETATSFAFHYYPESLIGTSTFEVRFVASTDEDLTYASFNLEFDHDGVDGIGDIEKPLLLAMTPNPANENVNIDLETIDGQVDVKIFNVLGEVMIDRMNIQGGQNFVLETSELQSGIYMVSVLQDGRILNTSRLMVKH